MTHAPGPTSHRGAARDPDHRAEDERSPASKTGLRSDVVLDLLTIVSRQDYPISICRGFTCSAFGTVTFRTPLSNRALMVSGLTAVGKVKLRWKRP